MNRLIFSLNTTRPSRCPICQQDLIAQAATTSLGIVLCSACKQTTSWPLLQHLHTHFHRNADPSHWTTDHGFYAYTPPPHHPRSRAVWLDPDHDHPSDHPTTDALTVPEMLEH